MKLSDINSRLSIINEKKKKLMEEIKTDQYFLNRLKNIEFTDQDYDMPSTNISKYELTEDLPDPTKDLKRYLEYREQVSDKAFFENIKHELSKISNSNGCRFFPKPNVNIGIISDEFLYNSFKGTANFHYITPDNYLDYKGKLDVMLIVSTWGGLDEEWRGLTYSKNTKVRDALKDIIKTFRNDTKIVFYSKEDPVNYDIFIDIAKLCDYILTTEEAVIERYKKDCGHDRVGVLRFGANPLYHNPIGMRNVKKRREVLFAGSWYKIYPERQKDTRMLFDGVLEAGFGLKIIDRNYNNNSDRYLFPSEYLPYISPSVTHEDLQKLHKCFDWAININTIKYSNTMFANRVYEMLALGNIVLSNYNSGINDIFPNVFLITDSSEVGEIMRSFNKTDIYKHQMEGLRSVFGSETTFHRISELLNFVGIHHEYPRRKIAVIVKEKTPSILDAFNRQSYEDKILLTEDEVNDARIEEFDMVTFFHNDYYYEEYYLEDLINGFKYTDCDYITRDSYYEGEHYLRGIEHDYVEHMKSKYRTVFWRESFDINELIQLEGEKSIPNGYSVDPFEFNAKIPEKENATQKYDLSVIIAVYNNGKHLYNKCFNSLRRSTIFERMEIILVDDGSSDRLTVDMVNRLGRQFSNVKTYCFPKGGSGSASRPRNKAIEISTAPYITYLDPDNEAVNDGYARLLREIKYNDLEIVMGNMIRLDNSKELLFDIHKVIQKQFGGDMLRDGKKFLINTNISTHSIQTMIIKKDVITSNALKMVDNAAGEDTIFFQELIMNASRIKAIDVVIHLYYAAVSGSVTNSISKRFFEKYLIIEEYRIEFLKRYGLLSTYMEKRFNYYFINWYLKRLPQLNKDDVIESIRILYKILMMYNPYITKREGLIKKFEKLCKKGDYSNIIKLVS